MPFSKPTPGETPITDFSELKVKGIVYRGWCPEGLPAQDGLAQRCHFRLGLGLVHALEPVGGQRHGPGVQQGLQAVALPALPRDRPDFQKLLSKLDGKTP